MAGASDIKILLVEDQPFDAELVELSLRRSGLRGVFRRVLTERDLVEVLETFKPDIVLSDHSLPQFSAADALRVVKRDAPGTPLIVVTGSLDEETAADYIRAGAADYIVKHHLERLGPAVRRALALKSAQEEQVRVERELRQSEERYRTLVDGVRDVVFSVTPQGIITSLNAAFEVITGWPVVQWVGRSFAELVHPEDARVAAALLGPEPPDAPRAAYQVRIRTKAGAHCVIEFASQPRYLDGKLVSVLGIGRDVSDRVRLEEQLRQVQKMEAIGQLAGGIAHDFNNLLTAILGSSELLLDQVGTDHAGWEDAQEIRQAALRAADLTRQLLAFSRQQVLAPRVLDLNALVRNLEKMLRRLIGENIELGTLLAQDLAAVRADPGQLEQVIMNLAINARDAMPEGGKLTIETANVELDDAYARRHLAIQPGRYVLLAVTDTGTGMSPETKAHVFEPFFTTKEKGKGTGLGLSTVYGIVKQSGGYVWVYSEPGQGATFKVYLPRVDAPIEVDRLTAAAAAPLGGSETVLIVEDQVEVRQLAQKVLEAKGYTVLAAQSGPVALRLAQAYAGPIHILVTDVVMPQMSGREVALRLTAERPGIKVLYSSGYPDESIVHHRILEPGLAFLQKPFTPDALARRVRELLDSESPKA